MLSDSIPIVALSLFIPLKSRALGSSYAICSMMDRNRICFGDVKFGAMTSWLVVCSKVACARQA
jgi:hypothetical protein